jgi:hypothetical protein
MGTVENDSPFVGYQAPVVHSESAPSAPTAPTGGVPTVFIHCGMRILGRDATWLVRTDVSEEYIASNIRVERRSELETLAMKQSVFVASYC